MDIHFDLLSLAAKILVLLFALLALVRVLMGKSSKKRYPPIAGTTFHQLINFSRLHDYHTDLSRKYKTFRLFSPLHNEIYTTDPANIEFILKTNFQNYGKGQFNHENMKDLFGDGIFTVDGEKWRHQRKLASSEFSSKVIKDFGGDVFKSNATKLAQVISEGAKSNKIMDIQDLFMKSTMDSIFKVMFGVELNCLHGSTEGSRFMKAFDDSSESIIRRYVDATWKIKKFLNIGSEAALKKNIKVVDDFVYKVIHTQIEQMSTVQRNDSVKKDDILSRLLVERQKDPQKMTNRYLKDVILNFLIAGKDTTADGLSWFIYMMCKHPLVQEKVAQEVNSASRASDQDVTFGEFATSNISDEALDKMQYLHATLTETLRLYPPVPLDFKVCFSDDTLPDGFNVGKGDIVFYQPYPMGRMEFLWGEDAETFRPERWLDDFGAFRPESPFKFTTFQAGPRTCLGKDFAYRQMKIFAAVLLRFFKFKLVDENKPVNYRTMITLHIDQGLHIYAYHR